MMSVEGQLVGMPLAGPESFSQQQLEYLKRAMGIDETVLFNANGTGVSTANLSESVYNFEKIRIYIGESSANYFLEEKTLKVLTNITEFNLGFNTGATNAFIVTAHYTFNQNRITCDKVLDLKTNYTNGTTLTIEHSSTLLSNIHKVVGIHRIAGGNQ